jgi:hypothetical protein
VRTIDLIDADSTQAGARFRGSIDDPIMLGGDVIVPRGANVGGAGLGAVIGGIAGGGMGAGIGALVGGLGGTIVAATGQPNLKIPAETRLAFQLAADWKIR